MEPKNGALEEDFPYFLFEDVAGLYLFFSQALGVDFLARKSLRGHDRNSKFMLDFT